MGYIVRAPLQTVIAVLDARRQGLSMRKSAKEAGSHRATLTRWLRASRDGTLVIPGFPSDLTFHDAFDREFRSMYAAEVAEYQKRLGIPDATASPASSSASE